MEESFTAKVKKHNVRLCTVYFDVSFSPVGYLFIYALFVFWIIRIHNAE